MFGTVGSAACLALGVLKLDMSVGEVLWCIAGSVVAGFVGLLLTLWGERVSPIKRTIMRGGLMTWFWLAAIYLSILWSIATPLHSMNRFFWMLFPLILSGFYGVVPFGPIQDRIIARHLRKLNKLV